MVAAFPQRRTTLSPVYPELIPAVQGLFRLCGTSLRPVTPGKAASMPRATFVVPSMAGSFECECADLMAAAAGRCP